MDSIRQESHADFVQAKADLELGLLCVQTWDLLVTRNTGIKGVLLFHIVPFLFLGAGSSRSRARKKEQQGTIRNNKEQ